MVSSDANSNTTTNAIDAAIDAIAADEILVERARTEAEAFGALYDRYFRKIYKYIYYRTGSVPDAEDLAERTFFQALTNLHRYESRGLPFSAWLFRIAHNLVANWHRDTKRHRTVPLEEPAVVVRSPIDPVSIAEKIEEHQELRAIIANLPSDRQQLLFLKFVEELPNAQIAQVMRRSEGAIKALLHRTIITLRGELTRQGSRRETNEPRIDKRNIVSIR